jgi:anti-sigma factor RsiW
MRPDEHTVAGLTCSEVMADLSAYLDGELPEERSARLEAHVASCQRCATFGAAFGSLIAQVRERLGEPARVPADVEARLRSALTLRR